MNTLRSFPREAGVTETTTKELIGYSQWLNECPRKEGVSPNITYEKQCLLL